MLRTNFSAGNAEWKSGTIERVKHRVRITGHKFDGRIVPYLVKFDGKEQLCIVPKDHEACIRVEERRSSMGRSAPFAALHQQLVPCWRIERCSRGAKGRMCSMAASKRTGVFKGRVMDSINLRMRHDNSQTQFL